MNFLEPTPTPFDLRFRLLGTPVRVHPSFWLIGALFGWGIAEGKLSYLLLYILCFFVSILLHEMGHALAARRFGAPSNIILFMFGGAATGMYQQLTGRQRFFIALAGPGIGFLFYFLLRGSYYVFEHIILTRDAQALPDGLKTMLRNFFESPFFRYLLFMNLFWNAMNLLPIIPLDGGQATREVCQGISPARGLKWALGISFISAGLVALYSLLKMQQPNLPYPRLDPLFVLIFFALMAIQSFTMLQQVSRQERRWDDENPY